MENGHFGMIDYAVLALYVVATDKVVGTSAANEFVRKFQALPADEQKQQMDEALTWLAGRQDGGKDVDHSNQDAIDAVAGELLADLDL